MNIVDLNFDTYVITPIILIILSNGFRKGKAERKLVQNKIKFQKYYNKKLPIGYNPTDYGKVITQFEYKYIVAIDSNSLVLIQKEDNYNLVQFYKNNNIFFF